MLICNYIITVALTHKEVRQIIPLLLKKKITYINDLFQLHTENILDTEIYKHRKNHITNL